MKRICLFCGSSSGNRTEFADAARHLGRLLANRGIGLVYGGGNVGLMGITADAALQAGGEVIGIIPGALKNRELAHQGLTQLHVVPSMHARKQLMHDLSDGFITLPGGFGTLDELFETLTWGQLGIHAKPIGLLNVVGYWNPLLQLLDGAVAAAVLKPEHRALVTTAEDPVMLLEKMSGFIAPTVPKWINENQT